MPEEVYAQAPGASALLGGLKNNGGVGAAPRVSLERRNRLFSKGNGSIIAHGSDKMEIPAK